LAAQGISLGYHNHSHEFLPTDYGKIIHRELEEKTDIAFEIDTYWAYHAGEDPVALLERLKDRVSVIHLKDGLADGTGKPLGMGTAPVASVYAKAKELGILMVIESETLTPSGMEEAKICADYMKAAEAKK
jgi:sugar phosphate isomerase/epimerase